MQTPQPVIELDSLTVAYQEQIVLDSVSLAVYPGNFLALVGPNGSGKTTLLKAIVGLVTPFRGSVKVFGKPPRALGPDRQRIGYVPQITSVDLAFPVSARDVVLMGRYGRVGMFRHPSAADRAAALRATERVGVSDLANRPLAHLSGGQRQRVFLARALANDPDLLLLDEPTAGVDALTTDAFYQLLLQLHLEGMTIVFVSHDPSVVARYADGVACINQQVVYRGEGEETMVEHVMACMYGPHAIFLDRGTIPQLASRGHGHSEPHQGEVERHG
jgi:ABC-type Mn2+/Zn2+ transport system ATPase subunit